MSRNAEHVISKKNLVTLSDAEAVAALNRGEVRRTGHLLHGLPAYLVIKVEIPLAADVVPADPKPKRNRNRSAKK